MLLLALLVTAGCSDGVSWVSFHGDALRLGWNPHETALTPAAVASGRFGKRWDSPPFDAFGGVPARAYASPLYLSDLKVTGGPFAGRTVDTVFAGTSNADVYAVSTVSVKDIPAGTVLWKTHLGDPGHRIDGLRIGVLGTPVIDLATQRLYVAAAPPRRTPRGESSGASTPSTSAAGRCVRAGRCRSAHPRSSR